MARIRRYRFVHLHLELLKTHVNCHLNPESPTILLLGPKFGHIASGVITAISTAYEGADYHIKVKVDVETSTANKSFRKEVWFITFNQISPILEAMKYSLPAKLDKPLV